MSEEALRPARDYYHGLGDYTRKNAALKSIKAQEAIRGTVIVASVPRDGWAQHVTVQDDAGTVSHSFASRWASA